MFADETCREILAASLTNMFWSRKDLPSYL